MRPIFGSKSLVLAILAAGLLLGATAADKDRAAPAQKDTRDLEGRPAPAFALETPAGDDVALADEAGNVLVLHFWATWCGPCHESMPRLQAIADDKSYAGRGLKLYAVNRKEDSQKVAAFTERLKLTLPVLMDESDATAVKYLVVGMPTTVVIGRDGRIANVFVGVGDDSDARLREAIGAALAASTQPATDRAKGSQARE